jgi:hypothetical protein
VTDLDTAARQHCRLFNASFRSGDWASFVATFADDARMAFTNIPAGPYSGRAAISAAYAENPPTDTMSIHSVELLDTDTARVRFAWDAGGGGTMVIRWRGDQVADLAITFD